MEHGSGIAAHAVSEAPVRAPHANEGRTIAAWVLVIGVVAGAIGIGAGLYLAQVLLIVGGGVVALFGLIAGFALRVTGRGQPLS